MSRYRKLEVRMWSDENYRALSPLLPSAQALWIYLLTGPQTGPIPGLYRAGRAQMAEELDWPLDAFYDAFAELEQRGMARADWKARLVWLPNAIKHNKPESPNVVRSWRVELDLLPECDLKREAIAGLRQTITTMGQPYLDAFEEALGGDGAKPAAKPSPKPSDKPSGEALPEALSESGTGTGTAAGNPTAAAPSAPPPAPASESPDGAGATVSAAQLSTAMRPFGINANPSQPDLMALAAQGITPDTVRAACEEAKRSKPNERISVAYVVGILKRWKAEAAKLDVAGAAAPKPNGGAWWASDASILAKGKELGLAPRAGESMPTFKGRIELAIGGQAPQPSPGRVIAPVAIETRGRKPEGLDLKALLRQVAPRGSGSP